MGYATRRSRGTTRRPRGKRYFKKGRRRGLGLVLGPLVVLGVLLGALVAVDYALNYGKIYPGVRVGSVNLGGLTPAEAREVVRERAVGELREIELPVPEGVAAATAAGPDDGRAVEVSLAADRGSEGFAFTAEEMGVDLRLAETVDAAYAVGREGEVMERVSERVRALSGDAVIPPEVDFRPAVARSRVQEVAAALDREPREASVEILGPTVRVEESEEGYRVDVAATMRNVGRAVEDLTGEAEVAGDVLEPAVTTEEAEAAAEKARSATADQLVLTAGDQRWTVSPADVGSALDVSRRGETLEVTVNRGRMDGLLSGVYEALDTEPVEAGYAVNGDEVSVEPGRNGKSVRRDRLLNTVAGGLFEGRREYPVPVATVEPELTTAEAEEMKPTELLGDYRTNYAMVEDNGERAENLQIASNAVDGTLLAPGEVFSMNGTVSHLDYNSTKVIIQGRETKADGGGLCQVTSTLYNAVNYAGLDVIERYPHNAQLPYIRPGLDATIWFGDAYGNGALDMKFQNTSDGYLLLRQRVAPDGYVYAEVYGRPADVEVTLRSEPAYMGEESSRWITYKKIMRDGQVIYDGELHTDTYMPLVDEDGETIAPPEVPVAPVDP